MHTEQRCQQRLPQRRHGHPQRLVARWRDQGCPQWHFQCRRPRLHSRARVHTDHRRRRRYLPPQREHGCPQRRCQCRRPRRHPRERALATQSVRASKLESASSTDQTKTSASSAVVVNQDAYRYGAINGARSGDLRADACAVSHLTRDTKVLIPSQPCQPEHALSSQPCQPEHACQPCQPEHALSSQPCQPSIMPVSPSARDAAVQTLPAPPLCEDSNQTRQPERAPRTGGKPCVIILPVSLSTHDDAIQTINIETSAGSTEFTTQSARSALSTKTPANGATMDSLLEKHIQERIIHTYGNGPYNPSGTCRNEKYHTFKRLLTAVARRQI